MGHLRTVFHHNPGWCFTTVCHESMAYIRPYKAQIWCRTRCRITVTSLRRNTARFRTISQRKRSPTAKNTAIHSHRPGVGRQGKQWFSFVGGALLLHNDKWLNEFIFNLLSNNNLDWWEDNHQSKYHQFIKTNIENKRTRNKQ